MLETVTLYLPAANSPAAELLPKKAKEPSFGLIDAAPRVEVTSAGFGGAKETTTSSPVRILTGWPLSSSRPFTLAPVVPIRGPPGPPQPVCRVTARSGATRKTRDTRDETRDITALARVSCLLSRVSCVFARMSVLGARGDDDAV